MSEEMLNQTIEKSNSENLRREVSRRIWKSNDAAEKEFNKPSFLKKFIRMYRSFPCLWKISSKEYSNVLLKNNAYEKLAELSLEVNPTANVNWVKKKIKCLRTVFRKELRKVQLSKESGANSDDIYLPKLWYYDHLLFTTDQETPCKSLSSIEKEESDNDISIPKIILSVPEEEGKTDNIHKQENAINENGVSTKRPAPAGQSPRRKFIKKDEVQDPRNELLSQACYHMRTGNDEAEILGKVWTMEYKKVKPEYQIFAKKAINDILFEAQLGTLHRNSIVINGHFNAPPFTRIPSAYFNSSNDRTRDVTCLDNSTSFTACDQTESDQRIAT